VHASWKEKGFYMGKEAPYKEVKGGERVFLPKDHAQLGSKAIPPARPPYLIF